MAEEIIRVEHLKKYFDVRSNSLLKKEKKIVDTGFVPGIYNYCDRWCERCPLQLRCMSYMMGKKLKERTKV